MKEETKVVNDIVVAEGTENTGASIDIKKPLIVVGVCAACVGVVKLIKNIPNMARKAKEKQTDKMIRKLEKQGYTVLSAIDMPIEDEEIETKVTDNE